MNRFKSISLTFAAFASLPLSAYAQDSDSSLTLLGLLKEGGWAMYPLGLTALFMFFLIFFCWRETTLGRFIPKPLLRPLTDALAERDVMKAYDMASATQTVLTRSLASGLLKARPQIADANREKVEAVFVDALEAEDGNIGQWINYLNVVAAVAPMIGLLGTVSGMISAFQTIGQVGMGDPSALASDIGEALITTATGLTIGIPAMVAYFIYRNRLTARMVETVEAGGNLIDALAGELGEMQEQQLHESD